MSEKKLRLALIGRDVSKSSSDKIHSFILKEFGYACEYEKVSVGAEEFDGGIRRLLGDFDGFNVTIPFKRDVMEYLDEIDESALGVGAVNTVVAAGAKGYNTDVLGFVKAIRRAGVCVRGKRCLVLGAGGAGRSVVAALKGEGAQVYLSRRRKEKLREACLELGVLPADGQALKEGGFDAVFNCTGVGMHESVGVSPVEKGVFAGAELAMDLIYQPRESAFLGLAREAGIKKRLNGEEMLFFQAYFADCLYLGKPFDDLEADTLFEKYTAEKGREEAL